MGPVVVRFDSTVHAGPWHWLYHDPLPIGLIAVALMAGTAALLGVEVPFALLAAAFCGTAFIYGLDRGYAASPEDRINRPRRVSWVRTRKHRLRIELLVLLGGLGASLWFLSWRTIGGAAILGGVGLVHSFPVLPGGRRLKEMGAVKPVVVAGVWAAGAVCLPLFESGAWVSDSAAWLCGYRFFFVLPNILLHDWGDREGDSASGVTTWADGWSLHTLRVTCTGVLAGAVIGVIIAVGLFGASPLFLVDLIGLGGMIGGVWSLRPGVSPNSAFLLDLVVAWPAVTWAVSAIGFG